MEKHGPPEIHDPKANPLEQAYRKFLHADHVTDTPEARHAFFAGIASGLNAAHDLAREQGLEVKGDFEKMLSRMVVIAGFGTHAYTPRQLEMLIAYVEAQYPTPRTEVEA